MKIKKSILGILAILPLCLAGCSSGRSRVLSSSLECSEDFYHAIGNVGIFSLTLSNKDFVFAEDIDHDTEGLYLGEAFSGMEIYQSYVNADYGAISIVTVGDLTSGYDHGSFYGRGLTTDNSPFEIKIPIEAAKLNANGIYFSSKKQNSVTLTMENGAFHSDIDKDDITLSGALEGASIDSVVPVLDTAVALTAEDITYQSVQVNFSDVSSSEQYGSITVLDSGTTYNGDLTGSFDMKAVGGEIIGGIDTWSLKQEITVAFANMNLNPSIKASDIAITGALEGTTIDSLEVIDDYGEYGKALKLNLTYPSSFVDAALDLTQMKDISSSFEFGANSNLEGKEFKIDVSAPRPAITHAHEYEESTRKLTVNFSFGNGLFNPSLSASSFTYYHYPDGDKQELSVSDASFSMSEDRKSFAYSCVLPEDASTNIMQVAVKELFLVSHSSGEKDTPIDWNFYLY